MTSYDLTQKTPEIDNRAVIIPDAANLSRDKRHRLSQFVRWLDAHGGTWHSPDLAAYRDHLLTRLAPSSARAHLSTIRGQYRRIVADRQYFYDTLVPDHVIGPADRKAYVDETIARIENAMLPDAAPVTVTTQQDVADSEHLRLTKGQANRLLAAPGTDTMRGLRDTAVIALLLCTGVREAELCALDVDDLRQYLDSRLSLRVREGKGAKQRLIPYGELDFVLAIVDAWLKAARIATGAVFRSFWKGNKRLRGRLSVRALQDILAAYPITVNGKKRAVRPHDCRRTYARRLYDAGMAIIAIQQNLGHQDHKTTLRYIGVLDGDIRQPPAIFSFDLDRLDDYAYTLDLPEA